MILLVLASLRLVFVVEGVFNAVWGAPRRRARLSRIFIYTFALGALGLVLGGIGAGLRTIRSGDANSFLSSALVAAVAPFLLKAFFLTLLYRYVPNARVRLAPAAVAGATCALGLELLRLAFGVYVDAMLRMNLITGSLAFALFAIVSLYFAWALILFGVELTQSSRRRAPGDRRPAPRGARGEGDPDAARHVVRRALAPQGPRNQPGCLDGRNAGDPGGPEEGRTDRRRPDRGLSARDIQPAAVNRRPGRGVLLEMELTFPMAVSLSREAPALSPDASDEVLLAAFRAGEARAFEVLVRRHQRAVIAVALRFVRDADVADELAQRAFIRALDGAEAFRGEASFRSWVLRIVVNLAKNHLRDHARFERQVDEEEGAPRELRDAGFEDPGERLDLEKRKALVRAAVTRLPPRQREVVLLRIDGDLAFAQVAEALGITENNAKVCFHLGVKRLRLLLSGAGPEELP